MVDASKLTRIQGGCYLACATSTSSKGPCNGESSQSVHAPKLVAQHLPISPEQTLCSKSDQMTGAMPLRPIRDSPDWLQAKEVLTYTDNKTWRLSITPSIIHIGTDVPYQFSRPARNALLDKTLLNKSLPDLPLNSFDEPPDGGFWAWAHTVAGHLAVFNAQ